jgi:hypothetical protein
MSRDSRDDELIREALKLNISVSDEVNSRVLRTVDRKKYHVGFGRTAVIAATCFIVLFGTGIIADAATGGRVGEYLRGKIDNLTYVYENGSNTNLEIVQKDGEEWEQVEYIEDNVVMSHPISADKTEYSLYLKVTDKNGNGRFISLVASVQEGETTEKLYYAIRGEFLWLITRFQNPNEKEQILTGLKEAAENTDSMTIRDALIDLSSDYENNHRIFYVNLPGKTWGEDEDIVIFEDISDLPFGEAAIVVNPVDNKEESWIFELQIDNNNFVTEYDRGAVYSDEYYQELLEKKISVYDLRKGN